MAEVKNNFLKSKMNKDLDDRLVPQGEYRHAQNISVAKSEGQDVGALENILGNNLVSNFTLPTDTYGVEIIGHFMDVENDRIVVFMTNYADTSGTLSEFSPIDAYHAIGVYNLNTVQSTIIVSGRFLNFSKTNEIYGVNLMNNLLFWTDNRNQPRKININNALENSSYYTTEDAISVSKYYPYQAIDLIREEVVNITTASGGTGYLPNAQYRGVATQITLPDTTGVGLTINFDTDAFGVISSPITIEQVGSGYYDGQQLTVIPGNLILTLSVAKSSTMRDVISEKLPDNTTDNPYRQPYGTGDITWQGDPEYLKDKFVRFSYRFKFDDGEYSLIAPFTQTCFIPKQDGYFIGDDDSKTYKSTEVEFMQNKVNDINLIINSPTGDWNNINQALKIEEVDILYKEAGQNNIKIVDTIYANEMLSTFSPYLVYNYKSIKPWKTLPEKEILRVHDQVPVRALAQELISNRIVYGNYVDKPTPPRSINYSLDIANKGVETQIEYQNQNLKQNRTYQVGIVLSDRYGRQSTVILSTLDESNYSSEIKASTIFHKYKANGFSRFPNPNSLFSSGSLVPAVPGDVWDGDNIVLTFHDIIASTKNINSGTPGLYNETTNPLGWYSYKIVIKQTQQDYYNIYFPGILNGYADGEAYSTKATIDEPICHFVLHGDNINKVPRDLTLVGPTQTSFRTGRPSAQEDPSYYQFVDSSGLGFTVDPFSEEGEKLLKERDRARDLDSGSQITNASVKLSLRLNNTIPTTGGFPNTLLSTQTTTQQAYPDTNLDTVTTIGTGSDLGLWDPAAIPPFNTANVFYAYNDNPYIAKTNVSDPLNTGIIGPHPLSGELNFHCQMDLNQLGSNYKDGSTNIPCTIPNVTNSGADISISGFKINIDGALASNQISIASSGKGWSNLQEVDSISGCKISGAGDGLGEFTLSWTKTAFVGKMSPSLAVYETEPLESKLDIYWETSTSGLIEVVNEAVETGVAEVPISFTEAGPSPVIYTQFESQAIGTRVTEALWPLNGTGTIITGPNTATITSVIDGAGSERRLDFNVFNDTSNGSFTILTAKNFVFLNNSNTVENYTFFIDIQVPSANYNFDGSFITRSLQLNAVGGSFLQNNAPSITNWPGSGQHNVSYFSLNPPAQGQPPILNPGGTLNNGGFCFEFNGTNGSVIGSQGAVQELTYSITAPTIGTVDISSGFYVDSSNSQTGSTKLYYADIVTGVPNNTIGNATLNIKDGGGMTTSYNIGIIY